ncbi:MAG: hypothetical protein LBE74_08785 [Treponema sp.]|nr:hypothetical protein [Treponema sp.]
MGNLTPVVRRDLYLINEEMDFQFSGEVSGESLQSITQKLGSQIIIFGEIFPLDRMYRLRIKAVSVEKAVYEEIISRDIVIENTLRVLIGERKNFIISVGGGLLLGGVFKTGTYREERKTSAFTPDNGISWRPADALKYTETLNEKEFDIGAYFFFDLMYAEINMSIFHASINNNNISKNEYVLNGNVVYSNDSNTGWEGARALLNIGILGKYPFMINRFTIFPTLGIEYQLWITGNNNNSITSGDISGNNSLWIRAGGGFDYEINRSLFLRSMIHWSFKTYNKNEASDKFDYFTHGPSIQIGIGYKF